MPLSTVQEKRPIPIEQAIEQIEQLHMDRSLN